LFHRFLQPEEVVGLATSNGAKSRSWPAWPTATECYGFHY